MKKKKKKKIRAPTHTPIQLRYEKLTSQVDIVESGRNTILPSWHGDEQLIMPSLQAKWQVVIPDVLFAFDSFAASSFVREVEVYCFP